MERTKLFLNERIFEYSFVSLTMEIIKRINEHLHGPDMRKILCLETKAGIKRNAAQTQDSTHHIVGVSVSNITDGTAAKFPKLNSLKRTIQRERRKANFVPVQPESSVELEIPMDYMKTAKNEPFLLYDSGQEERRILIFGAQKNIEMLELSQIWLVDGTWFGRMCKSVHTLICFKSTSN